MAVCLLLTAALATTVFATACGEDAGGGKTVSVVLSEYKVAPSVTSAAAGKVTFKVSNKGAVAHELIVIKTDTAADNLPVSGLKVAEDKAGKVIGEIEVAKGKSESDTWELTAGKYVFICNIEGHYKEGMHAAFTVQ